MYSQCDECIDSFECVKVKSMLFPRKTISCSISSFSPVNNAPAPPNRNIFPEFRKLVSKILYFCHKFFCVICLMFKSISIFSSLFIYYSESCSHSIELDIESIELNVSIWSPMKMISFSFFFPFSNIKYQNDAERRNTTLLEWFSHTL